MSNLATFSENSSGIPNSSLSAASSAAAATSSSASKMHPMVIDHFIGISVKMPRFERLVTCPRAENVAWLIKEIERLFFEEHGYPVEVAQLELSGNSIVLRATDMLLHASQSMKPHDDHFVAKTKPKTVCVAARYYESKERNAKQVDDASVEQRSKSVEFRCSLSDNVSQIYNTAKSLYSNSDWSALELVVDDKQLDDEILMSMPAFKALYMMEQRKPQAATMYMRMVPTPEHLRITSCFQVRDVFVEDDGMVRFLCFTDADMILALRQRFDEWQELFAEKPQIRAMSLLHHLHTLRGASSEKLNLLAQYLEKENESILAPIKTALAAGKIAFDALWYHFSRGQRLVVVAETENKTMHEVAIDAAQTKYTNNGAVSFSVYGNVIESNGTQLYEKQCRFRIDAYNGMRDLTALPIRHVTADDTKRLTERGRRFVAIVKGVSHMQYTGCMMEQVHNSSMLYAATGRVMVDTRQYMKYCANAAFCHSPGSAAIPFVKENDLPRCVPTLGAWSLTLKRWGQVFIDNLSDVQYDSGAFDRVVLDDDHKSVIAAMVQNFDKIQFSDIVADKGKGIVFLLNGPPGVGKTVTAEAIAEMVKKPLYVVSAGELGVDAKSVDEALERIIAMTSAWEALVLIDEADVLMTARDDTVFFSSLFV